MPAMATGEGAPMPGAPMPPLAHGMPGRPPMPMGGNPTAGPAGQSGAPGTEMPLPAAPPPQPMAGGPTSPLNAMSSGMLTPNQQPPTPGAPSGGPKPLQPWGDSTETTGAAGAGDEGGLTGGETASANGKLGMGADGMPDPNGMQGQNPMIMLKMMHMLGHI